jgi:hypothetical protein
MGLKIGRLLKDLGSFGGTYFKREKKAKKKEKEAEALIASNTELAQSLYDQAASGYGQSALESLAADPLTTAAQQRVLARYGQLANEGWTAEDRAALEQQQMESRRMEQSQRQGVLDAAARRGDASGGNTVLAGLMAQQGGANRDAQRGTTLAIAGRQRALDALAQEGALAGQMRSQGVNEQVARGSAMDQFRQWGAGMQMNAAQTLMNARLGQSQSLQQQAANMQATPNLDAGVNAYFNWQTAGVSGALGGGGESGASAKPSPGPYGAPPAGGGGHETGHAKMSAPLPQTQNPLAGQPATSALPQAAPGSNQKMNSPLAQPTSRAQPQAGGGLEGLLRNAAGAPGQDASGGNPRAAERLSAMFAAPGTPQPPRRPRRMGA